MAQFPALPLFTDAFIGDTTHLNAAQTGALIMLLMIAWRTKENALPDDDVKLSRWARMSRRTWLANKSLVLEQWKLGKDNYWRQSRLDDERKIVTDKREKNIASGHASALKRHKLASTNVQPEVNERSTTPTPTPIPIPLSEEKEREEKKNTPAKQETKHARIRKPQTFISDSFQPDIKSIALAGRLGLDLDREHSKFVSYWQSRGDSKADWDATFRNWLERAADYGARDQQRQVAGRQETRDVTGAALRAAEVLRQRDR